MEAPATASPAPRRRRSLLKRAAALLISFVLSLLLAELAVRLLLPQYAPAPSLEFVRGERDLALGTPGLEVVHWENWGDFEVTVRFNQYGLRDAQDVSALREEDVLVIGDSFAMGWGVDEGARFSSRLADLLGRRVFNVALPEDLEGYGRMVELVRSLGGRPRQVVISVCMENDLKAYGTTTRRGSTLVGHSAAAQLKGRIRRSSALYAALSNVQPLRRLAERLGMLEDRQSLLKYNDVSPEVVDLSVACLERVVAGLEPVVLVVPSRSLWAGAVREAEEKVHARFVDTLRARGVRVVDPRAAFESGGAPLAFYFPHDGHWTPEAHAVAARLLAEAFAAAPVSSPR